MAADHQREMNVHYTWRGQPPQRVISGAGCRHKLAVELARMNAGKVLLVSTNSLRNDEHAGQLRSLIGEQLVGEFFDCRQHTPRSSVSDLLQRITADSIDTLVSFGGGSVICTAKAAVYERCEQAGHPPQHLALPTTLSVAEFTATTGVTEESTGIKHGYYNPALSPACVLMDPELSLATPPELWLATGIKAIDHALEALWAIKPHPLASCLARDALAMLMRSLHPSAVADGNDSQRLALRLDCQQAAWQAVTALGNTGGRLSHAIGHQLGGAWNIPHGVTSCIVLPHVMRYLAGSDPAALEQVCDVMAVPRAGSATARGLEAAQNLENLIEKTGMPNSLESLGASMENLEDVAGAIVDELARSPRTSEQLSPAQMQAMLRSMW